MPWIDTEEMDIEFTEDSAITHHRIHLLRGGKKRIEVRVYGSCTINGIEYSWDSIVEVPLLEEGREI